MKNPVLVLVILFIFIVPSAAQEDPARGALERLLQAFEALDVDRNPTAAERLFRSVHEDEDAPHALRGRALAGLVGCSLLSGRSVEAAERLRLLRENYADVPEVARRLPALSASLPGTTSYISGVRWFWSSAYLDLDTGEMYGKPREEITPELRSESNKLSFLIPKTPAPGFEKNLVPISSAPWVRVTTDQGRRSWVQVLRPGSSGGLPVVRFVTRIAGEREPLATVDGLFAVGDGKSIVLHFDLLPIHQGYRVERREGLEGPFMLIGHGTGTPFLDLQVVPGVRYTYRVTGIGTNGEQAIPAFAVGTTGTLGVTSGRLVVDAVGKTKIDLHLGRVVPKDGDLTLQFYGGIGRFTCSVDEHIAMPREPGDAEEARTMLPWDGPVSGGMFAEEGRWYRVPLRDAGVARIRCRPLPDGRFEVEYFVNPSGPRFDAVAEVVAERTDAGVALRVKAPKGYSVKEVSVDDAVTGQTLATIPVQNGRATDGEDRTGRIVVYRATGEDRLGRRSVTGEVCVNFLPDGPTSGRFRFHYQSGWSFTRMAVVEPEEADLIFEYCAGGLSEVRLRAPGGITNLSRLKLEADQVPSTPALFRALVFADPAAIELADTSSGDSRTPRSDVFVMRTRDGAWVKLAIVYREGEGNWMKRLVSVTFVINAKEPVFETFDADHREAGFGLRLATIAEPTVPIPEVIEKQKRAEPILREIAALDERAAELAAMLRDQNGRGVKVGALFSRTRARALGRKDAYRVATYSFEHETRDDRDKTRNDWDIQLTTGRGGLQVHVNMGSDDRSAIFDLGRTSIEEAMRNPPMGISSAEEVTLKADHVYAIHNLDSNSDYWTLLQVLEITNGRTAIFRFKRLRTPGRLEGLQRLPGKTLRLPVVRLQLRAGAGGGNANQVFMDGTTNKHVREVSDGPLDLSGKIETRERSRAFVEGGNIPANMWFRIDEVEYTARVAGDSNGHGEFVLFAAPHRIVHIETDRREKGALRYRTLADGSSRISPGDTPVAGRASVRIYVRAGRESDVYAQVANSSACDVTLRGEFVTGDQVPTYATVDAPERSRWRTIRFLLDNLQEQDQPRMTGFDNFGADPIPYLEELLRQGASGDYRNLIEQVLLHVKSD